MAEQNKISDQLEHSVPLYFFLSKLIYRPGQKLDCFCEFVTLRLVMGERRVLCHKFHNFIQKKSIKLACQCI